MTSAEIEEAYPRLKDMADDLAVWPTSARATLLRAFIEPIISSMLDDKRFHRIRDEVIGIRRIADTYIARLRLRETPKADDETDADLKADLKNAIEEIGKAIKSIKQ